jgi:hypothetical protein
MGMRGKGGMRLQTHSLGCLRVYQNKRERKRRGEGEREGEEVRKEGKETNDTN